MYSVKNKLKKSLIIQMILLMLLISLMLYVFMQQLFKQQLLTRLQHDVESLITVLQQMDDRWHVDPAHISTVYNRVRSGHYYVIKTDGQILRSRSLFDFEFSIPESVGNHSESYLMDGPGEEKWLVWQQLIVKNNQAFQFWVAEDIAPVQQQLFLFLLIAILIIIALSFLFIVIQQKILDRAFDVFDTLRQNINAIRQGNSAKPDVLIPREISPLVNEIEKLVLQLGQRIQRTRNAIGNLAHEIKRPLQILSLYIHSGGDKQSAIGCFDDIQAIVDRELRRAKISGTHVVGGSFDIRQEIPVLIQLVHRIYPQIDIQLEIQLELAEINLDRDDMLELCGNLIDNAAKFARHKVTVQVGRIDEILSLIIEDDGQGVEPQHLNKITTKGYRLDERKEGHGLGLSICADIIHSYQGRLDFSTSKMGGLKVSVSIPLMPG